MEWIPRAMLSGKSVSPADLKICALCGALNHDTNKECFTCGWHGQFCYEPAQTELAWRRLVHQHEIVLMEHVTGRTAAVLDDFGRRRQTNIFQRLAGSVSHWCHRWRNAFVGRRSRVTPRPETRQPAAPQSDL